MTRQRKRPLTQGEKSRMIKARKDSIMKKVEELQNLTELDACLIIPMPDGKFETWPKDGDKLQEVFKLYEENLRSQKENTNQTERSCCVTDRQSCHESSAGLEEGVSKEENQYLASDFGCHELAVANEEFSGKELLPWCEMMNSLPYSSTEVCHWFDESFNNSMMADTNTTSDGNTTFQLPLQYCYPETNFGSLYGSTSQPAAVPLQVSYPARTLPVFESREFLGSDRIFQPYPCIQEEGKILRDVVRSTTQEDVNRRAVGSWSTMAPQVFTQYHADYMGGSMHNGKRGYLMWEDQ